MINDRGRVWPRKLPWWLDLIERAEVGVVGADHGRRRTRRRARPRPRLDQVGGVGPVGFDRAFLCQELMAKVFKLAGAPVLDGAPERQIRVASTLLWIDTLVDALPPTRMSAPGRPSSRRLKGPAVLENSPHDQRDRLSCAAAALTSERRNRGGVSDEHTERRRPFLGPVQTARRPIVPPEPASQREIEFPRLSSISADVCAARRRSASAVERTLDHERVLALKGNVRWASADMHSQ
jgi:hypothetical protein